MAGLIRREQVPAPHGRPSYSLPDFERRARDTLAEAERQAAIILANARERAAQIESSAQARAQEQFREGLEQGRIAGTEEGRAEVLRQVAQARAEATQNAQADVRAALQALEAACAQLEPERHGLLAQAEAGLIELALAIARRVCGITAGRSSDVALAHTRALLEVVRHCSDVELHLHPRDHEHVAALAPQRASGGDGLTHVHLVADTDVERGGCVLRTSDGVIEANLSTQLDRIAQALCGDADGGAAVASLRSGDGDRAPQPTVPTVTAIRPCPEPAPGPGASAGPGLAAPPASTHPEDVRP